MRFLLALLAVMFSGCTAKTLNSAVTPANQKTISEQTVLHAVGLSTAILARSFSDCVLSVSRTGVPSDTTLVAKYLIDDSGWVLSDLSIVLAHSAKLSPDLRKCRDSTADKFHANSKAWDGRLTQFDGQTVIVEGSVSPVKLLAHDQEKKYSERIDL
jgi:hypothetical protein